jgi:2-dehydro-3-deoxygluconokinase
VSSGKAWDVVAMGEGLVEFNQRGSDAREYRLGHGGDTSNCVIAASRLGARCAYITQVGDDRFGTELMDLWKREDIALDGVRVLRGGVTGLYFVDHGPQGHRFSYRRAGSAASLLRAEDVPDALVAQAKWLHVSGISQAISASARAAVSHAIQVARSNGTRVSYDLNFRPALASVEEARAMAAEVLPHCDLFFPSVDEIAMLTGIDEAHEVLRWSHQQGARAAVLKLGARGCLVSEGGVLTEVPGVPAKPVDATGAGDCFAGACLSRLAKGESLVEAARFANRAAAFSTQGFGAVEPLPRLVDLAVG